MEKYNYLCMGLGFIITILLIIIYKLKQRWLIQDGIEFKGKVAECIEKCMSCNQKKPKDDDFTLILYKEYKIVVYDKTSEIIEPIQTTITVK